MVTVPALGYTNAYNPQWSKMMRESPKNGARRDSNACLSQQILSGERGIWVRGDPLPETHDSEMASRERNTTLPRALYLMGTGRSSG